MLQGNGKEKYQQSWAQGEPFYNSELFSLSSEKMPCARAHTCMSLISDFHRAVLLVCLGPASRQLPCHSSFASSICSCCSDAARVAAEAKQVLGVQIWGANFFAALPDMKRGSCFIPFLRFCFILLRLFCFLFLFKCTTQAHYEQSVLFACTQLHVPSGGCLCVFFIAEPQPKALSVCWGKEQQQRFFFPLPH